MSDNDRIQEEPQEARGEPGSRDVGEGPGGGPTDRPADDAEPEDESGVNPLPPITDTPVQQTGDQGG
jgi:hypothetical protein